MRRLYFTFSLKSKIVMVLILLLSVSCRTVYVENVRNTKDSVENVQLKEKLSVTEKFLLESNAQLELSKKEISKLLETINLSESEKQLLNEKLTTIIEEYDQNGILIKKTYTEKVSELAKDLTKSEQKNKFLENQLAESQSKLETLQAELDSEIRQNTNLDSKVKVLTKENSELKTESKSQFQWWLILIGFFIGLAVYFYLDWLVRKIKSKVFS